MSEAPSGAESDDDLLTTDEAAPLTPYTASTLKALRLTWTPGGECKGPAFIRFSRRKVRYKRGVIKDWVCQIEASEG